MNEFLSLVLRSFADYIIFLYHRFFKIRSKQRIIYMFFGTRMCIFMEIRRQGLHEFPTFFLTIQNPELFPVRDDFYDFFFRREFSDFYRIRAFF